jgi:hypothetical protein
MSSNLRKNFKQLFLFTNSFDTPEEVKKISDEHFESRNRCYIHIPITRDIDNICLVTCCILTEKKTAQFQTIDLHVGVNESWVGRE